MGPEIVESAYGKTHAIAVRFSSCAITLCGKLADREQGWGRTSRTTQVECRFCRREIGRDVSGRFVS